MREARSSSVSLRRRAAVAAASLALPASPALSGVAERDRDFEDWMKNKHLFSYSSSFERLTVSLGKYTRKVVSFTIFLHNWQKDMSIL